MTLQFWFWLLMAIWLIFGVWRSWGTADGPYVAGGHFLHFVLLGILGWQVFGAPVK